MRVSIRCKICNNKCYTCGHTKCPVNQTESARKEHQHRLKEQETSSLAAFEFAETWY